MGRRQDNLLEKLTLLAIMGLAAGAVKPVEKGGFRLRRMKLKHSSQAVAAAEAWMERRNISDRPYPGSPFHSVQATLKRSREQGGRPR